ncbi:MAG: hypothetical protein ACRECH_11980 [Nitrososphaerales archaeon]
MNVSRFLNKQKPMTELVTSAGSEEECDNCKSAGKVQCVYCQSKGFVKKFKTEQLKCDVCAGAGKMSTPCLACSGTGTATRKLRYEDKGGQGAIYQQGILFNAKRTQTVSVLLKNTDEIAGKFEVLVTLRDGKSTNAKASVTLRPDESAPVALSFYPVSSKDGHPARYEIIPEEVQETCNVCAAQGRIERTCLACQGIGQAQSQRQIPEICSNCAGAGQTRCSKCKGAGRVRA